MAFTYTYGFSPWDTYKLITLATYGFCPKYEGNLLIWGQRTGRSIPGTTGHVRYLMTSEHRVWVDHRVPIYQKIFRSFESNLLNLARNYTGNNLLAIPTIYHYESI